MPCVHFRGPPGWPSTYEDVLGPKSFGPAGIRIVVVVGRSGMFDEDSREPRGFVDTVVCVSCVSMCSFGPSPV